MTGPFPGAPWRGEGVTVRRGLPRKGPGAAGHIAILRTFRPCERRRGCIRAGAPPHRAREIPAAATGPTIQRRPQLSKCGNAATSAVAITGKPLAAASNATSPSGSK